MPTARYPKAAWRGDGVSGGSYTSGPFKLVIHTTETSGIPGYVKGGSAPHITYYPRTRSFVQHTTFLVAARSLVNQAGGIQTNRDSALQLEIVCYSQESVVDKYPNTGRVKVSELSAEQLADIREFILWACNEFGIEYKWPEKQAFSYLQANRAGFRMSNAEWDAYNGVCGHQHVPENFHWDPGAINWLALMEGELTKEGELTNAELQAGLTEFFGGRSVGAPNTDQAGRVFVKGIVDSVWWAKTNGDFMLNHLVKVRQTVDLTKGQVAGLVTAVAGISLVAGANASEIVAEIGRLLAGG